MKKLLPWLPTLVLGAMALLAWQRKVDTLSSVEAIEAEVLGLPLLNTNPETASAYHVVYGFTTADGRAVHARSTNGETTGLPAVGERVTIYCDPRLTYAARTEPVSETALVHMSIYSLVLVPCALSVVALVAAGLTFVWVSGTPKRERKRAKGGTR